MALAGPRSGQLAMLDDEALSRLANGGAARGLASGEVLFRQGTVADAAYVVTRGQLAISTRIPGDETAMVSAILPGEVVGEFALLDDRPRSASVLAFEPSAVLCIPRLRFASLLADEWPPAYALIGGLCQLVASRIRATLGRIEADGRHERSCLRKPGPIEPMPQLSDADPATALAMLPRLSALALHAPQLAGIGRCLAAGRGVRLADPGDAPDRLLLVLRGALRTAIPRPGGLEQVAIHGPGEMVGLVALLDGEPQPLLVEAAEESLLLALDRSGFEQLRARPSALGRALFEAIGRQLVRDQVRANRHVGRNVALARFNAAGEADAGDTTDV